MANTFATPTNVMYKVARVLVNNAIFAHRDNCNRTLDDEFKVLEAGSGLGGDVDDRLLALKQEMGMLGAGEAEKPRQPESGDDEPVAEAAEATSEGGQKTGSDEGADGKDEAVEADAAANNEGDPPIQEAQLIEEFDRLEQQDS